MAVTATIIFAGGGTGGHLFPGIAVADELRLRHPSWRILFVGTSRAIEAKIVAEHALEHRVLPVESLTTFKRNPFRFAFRNWMAQRTAQGWIRELCPSAVVGLGGYASAPLVYHAYRNRIPVILLEQNAIPGRTTRWLSRYANQVCLAMEEARPYLKNARQSTLTGNPVRREIAALLRNRTDAENIGIDPSFRRHLVVLGGSQGADSLNSAVLRCMEYLTEQLKDWRIVHQTGPNGMEAIQSTYLRLGLDAVVQPFFHDMADIYHRANLIVSRSGATTLAELSCAGQAMILLPYPFAADQHQSANAQRFAARNAAFIVEHAVDPATTARELADALKRLIADPALRSVMGRNAQDLACPAAAKTTADLIEAEIEHDRSSRSR